MAYRNLIGADNFFETASKEELIDFLIKKINSEVEKGDGADCDLIRECSDWLDELTQDEIVFTPKELKQNLEKIKANVLLDKPAKNRKRFSAKTFVRVALIAAVVFTISIVSLSAVAVNNGYSSAWEYVSENIGKVLGLNDHETIKENGITVIINTENIKYESITDFINGEELNILYPHKLPENINTVAVRYIQKSQDTYTLCFSFSNPKYIFNVSNYCLADVSSLDSYECLTINNLKYYIKKHENVYYSILQHNGWEYTIQTPNYDDLVLMINSMKG